MEDQKEPNKLKDKGKILIRDLFRENLDDLEDFFEWKQEQLRAKLPPDKKDEGLALSEFIEDINLQHEKALIAFIVNVGKYYKSKGCAQLSMRVGFDLLDKRHRMLLSEHFSWEQLYMFGMMATTVRSAIEDMPNMLGKANLLDAKQLSDMPPEMKAGLLKTLQELVNKLKEEGDDD